LDDAFTACNAMRCAGRIIYSDKMKGLEIE